MEMLNVFLTVIYVVCCLFLGFVVLIQKGEGGGLGGAFGGGAVDQAFGAKADMTWKRATAAAAALFMVLAIALGVIDAQMHEGASMAERAAKRQQAEREKQAAEEKAAQEGKAGEPAGPSQGEGTGTLEQPSGPVTPPSDAGGADAPKDEQTGDAPAPPAGEAPAGEQPGGEAPPPAGEQPAPGAGE